MVVSRFAFPIIVVFGFGVSLSAQTAGGQRAEVDVETLVQRGRRLAENKEFRKALVPLDAAVAAAPSHIAARRWRGHVRTAIEDHAGALADLDVAVNLDSSHAWAFYARGMAKHNLGRLAAAIPDYSKALTLDPKNHKAVEWRGYTQALLGDHLAAWMDYTRATELDPRNPWVYFVRGKSALVLGALKRARNDFTKAVALDPKHADAHAQLGYVMVAMGETAKALPKFEKAIELDSGGQDYARLWRYWLRSKLGKMGRYPLHDLPDRGWPADLGKVLAGGMFRTGILKRVAMHGTEPSGLKSRLCEAYFYLGLRARLEGQANRAREYLRTAIVRGDSTMPEWHAALRLARM